MSQRFCTVLKIGGRMYLAQLANANGPNVIVLPLKPLHHGIAAEQLAVDIESALTQYSSLNRSIFPAEWKERAEQIVRSVGEKSEAGLQRRKQDVTVRFDSDKAKYHLFDGKSGAAIAELTSTIDTARTILERLGEPGAQSRRPI